MGKRLGLLMAATMLSCASASALTLKEAMADHKAPWAAKIAAAIAILDRGWGKPTQQVAANVSFFDQMSDEEQRIMLAALEALRDGEP